MCKWWWKPCTKVNMKTNLHLSQSILSCTKRFPGLVQVSRLPNSQSLGCFANWDGRCPGNGARAWPPCHPSRVRACDLILPRAGDVEGSAACARLVGCDSSTQRPRRGAARVGTARGTESIELRRVPKRAAWSPRRATKHRTLGGASHSCDQFVLASNDSAGAVRAR